jgi:hypothetical protein
VTQLEPGLCSPILLLTLRRGGSLKAEGFGDGYLPRELVYLHTQGRAAAISGLFSPILGGNQEENDFF